MSTPTIRPRIGLGMIGCGAFGSFCLNHYRRLDSVRLTAVADADPGTAQAAADRFGIDACPMIADLLARDDVDLIHLATPPTTHRDLAMQALRAGKHLLCEKPLATNVADAVEMIELARRSHRLLAANLIMRYDPLCQMVATILEEGLIGAPLHAFFENYAKDEPLPPGHWFWDPDQSGGIFIEHGVHFFDLFALWFGAGNVVAAQQGKRPGTADLIEQVACTVRYDRGVLAHFYHGFHQATRMDRQEMRIVCERGDIRLHGWLPTRLEIDALFGTDGLRRTMEVLPGADCDQVIGYHGDLRQVRSRHKGYRVDGRYHIRAGAGAEKGDLYGMVLRALLDDQVQAIRDHDHRRRITEHNGLDSLKLAAQATALAKHPDA